MNDGSQLELMPSDVPRADLALRDQINTLEARMLEMPQVEIPTWHHFSQGLYAREIFIPRGTILTGKIHRYSHLNIISLGDISVMTDHGVKRITAPYTMVSPPNTKRAGYAHADTVWTTIHATNETDLDKLEAELITPVHMLEGEIAAMIQEIAKCHG